MIKPIVDCFNRVLRNKLCCSDKGSEECACNGVFRRFSGGVVLKRLASAVLCAAMLFSMTACTPATSSDTTKSPNSPDPTGTVTDNPVSKLPEYERETVLLKDINEYTIVYPSDYTDYRKQDVEFLQKVMKDVTGASLNIISDLEEASGKEIIIASSKRKNGVEETIDKFESGLDYVVAVRNGNIVLGGNNFYADIRAIYDFINNTLGYNDIDDVKEAPKTELSGVNYNIYEEPPIMITASNLSVIPFTKQYVIRDMAEAHFNTMTCNAVYNEAQLRDLLKWCARYSIFLIGGGWMHPETGVDALADTVMYDCPIVLSSFLYDEPSPLAFEEASRQCDLYVKGYGDKDWYPFMNFTALMSHASALIEWEGYFESVPMISFDVYPSHSLSKYFTDTLGAYELYSYLSKSRNKDLWVYIESELIGFFDLNTEKMFRWQSYMALTFGVKNILYFQYCNPAPEWLGDKYAGAPSSELRNRSSLINDDENFTKNPAWYDAQHFNVELLKIAAMYKDYEQKGACTMNAPSYEKYLNYNSPYPNAKDIVPECICEDEKNYDAYLVGFFDKKDNSNAHALTLVNISDLNDDPYESDEAKYVKFKINGENVTFYRNGDPQKVEKTDDGYYRLNMANGYCWFVTVD